MNKVEAELNKATGLTRGKRGESRPAYLERLLDAASDLDDSVWAELSDEAQAWVNENVKTRNADKDLYPVTDFGGASEAEEAEAPIAAPKKRGRPPKVAQSAREEEAEEAAPDTEDADEAPESASTGRRKAVRKEAKSSGSSNGAGPRKVGAQHEIKRLLTKKPKLTPTELHERLQAAGYTATPLAISSIRSGWRNTVKILQEAGVATEIEL